MATKSTPADVLRPIPPGISWTAPDKSRTWQQPPKFVKLTDVVKMYMDGIMSEEIGNNLLDSLETGIPLSVIAEAMMLSGVSKGVHTIDTGILAMPVIMEMLKSVAVFNNIDTKMFASDYDKEETASPRIIREAVSKVFNKKVVEPTEETEKPMSGLMGRKNKEVI